MTTPSLTDPTTLYLLTSLTSGSSSILTATMRLESLLKTHKIPFVAIDVATDEKARMLWGRRSKGRRLPGVVKGGEVLGNFEECEEWNEYGELRMVLLNEPLKQPEPPVVPESTMEKDKKIAESVHSRSTQGGMTSEERKTLLEQISGGSAVASLKKSPSVASQASVSSVATQGSMAQEAAKKAKEMQLNALRERVRKREEEKERRAKEQEEAKKAEDDLVAMLDGMGVKSEEAEKKEVETTTTDPATATKEDSSDNTTTQATTDEKQPPSPTTTTTSTGTIEKSTDEKTQVQVAVEGEK